MAAPSACRRSVAAVCNGCGGNANRRAASTASCIAAKSCLRIACVITRPHSIGASVRFSASPQRSKIGQPVSGVVADHGSERLPRVVRILRAGQRLGGRGVTSECHRAQEAHDESGVVRRGAGVSRPLSADQGREAFRVDVAAGQETDLVLNVGEDAECERRNGRPLLAQLRPRHEQFAHEVVVALVEIPDDQGLDVGQDRVVWPADVGGGRAPEVGDVEEEMGEPVGILSGADEQVERMREDGAGLGILHGGERTTPDAGDPATLREHGRGLVDRVRENACAPVGSEVVEGVVTVAESVEEHVRHRASEHLVRVQGHVRECSRRPHQRCELHGQSIDAVAQSP